MGVLGAGHPFYRSFWSWHRHRDGGGRLVKGAKKLRPSPLSKLRNLSQPISAQAGLPVIVGSSIDVARGKKSVAWQDSILARTSSGICKVKR